MRTRGGQREKDTGSAQGLSLLPSGSAEHNKESMNVTNPADVSLAMHLLLLIYTVPPSRHIPLKHVLRSPCFSTVCFLLQGCKRSTRSSDFPTALKPSFSDFVPVP